MPRRCRHIAEHSRRPPEHPDAAAHRQSDSLAALSVTLLLIVVGLYLIDTLRAQAALQDCVLSGRLTCAIADGIGPASRDRGDPLYLATLDHF